MDAFDKLAIDVEEINQRIRDKAMDELKPALKELMTKIKEEMPKVTHIRWTQYVPGFNDGDVCVFSVNTIGVKFDDADSDAGDDEDGYYEVYDYSAGDEYGIGEAVKKKFITAKQAKYLSSLNDKLQSVETLLEACFGDDAQVTLNIKKGKIETEEYTGHD